MADLEGMSAGSALLLLTFKLLLLFVYGVAAATTWGGRRSKCTARDDKELDDYNYDGISRGTSW